VLPATSAASARHRDVRRERDQFNRVSANAVGIARRKAIVDLHVAAIGPAQLFQRLLKRRDAGLRVHIARVHACAYEHADAAHALLRARGERPGKRHCHRAAEKGDELSPPHVHPQPRGDVSPSSS
jgi:hypothetical protein